MFPAYMRAVSNTAVMAFRLTMSMAAGFTAGMNLPAGMKLPLAAIYQTGDTPEVWVVGDDETVHLTPVSVTQFDADDVLVDGLDAGTIVVTAGVHCLEEGQSVRTEADR